MADRRHITGVTIDRRMNNDTLSAIWKNHSHRIPLKQVTIFTALCALVLCATGYFLCVRSEYVPLFDAKLSAAETSRTISSLSASGMDYSVVNNGSCILVPRKDRSEALMKLAMRQTPTDSPSPKQGPPSRFSSPSSVSSSTDDPDPIGDDKKALIEKGLQRKAQSVLDDVVGAHRGRVAVNATLGSSSREVVTYRVGDQGAASGQVKEREKTFHESYVKSRDAEETSDEDPPRFRGEKKPGGKTQYDKSGQTVVYKFDQTKKREITSPGSVERISASVVVDDLSPEEVAKVNALIRDAIGADETRGDSITVVSRPSGGGAGESGWREQGSDENSRIAAQGNPARGFRTSGYPAAITCRGRETAASVKIIVLTLCAASIAYFLWSRRPSTRSKYERYWS